MLGKTQAAKRAKLKRTPTDGWQLQKPLIEADGAVVFGEGEVLGCKMDSATNLVHRGGENFYA